MELVEREQFLEELATAFTEVTAVPIIGPLADVIREGVSGIVSSASDGKHGALPLTLRQRGYDGARIEYVNAANQNATKYASEVNQANRALY